MYACTIDYWACMHATCTHAASLYKTISLHTMACNHFLFGITLHAKVFVSSSVCCSSEQLHHLQLMACDHDIATCDPSASPFKPTHVKQYNYIEIIHFKLIVRKRVYATLTATLIYYMLLGISSNSIYLCKHAETDLVLQ